MAIRVVVEIDGLDLKMVGAIRVFVVWTNGMLEFGFLMRDGMPREV